MFLSVWESDFLGVFFYEGPDASTLIQPIYLRISEWQMLTYLSVIARLLFWQEGGGGGVWRS